MIGVIPPETNVPALIVGFHDGHLTGILNAKDGQLILWCSTVDGVRYQLEFESLEMLRVNEFSGNNIIGSMLIFEATELPRKIYSDLYLLGDKQFEGLIDLRLQGFKSSGLKVLEVATADGCRLLASFKCDLRDIKITLTS
jgi:hypothetical protein